MLWHIFYFIVALERVIREVENLTTHHNFNKQVPLVGHVVDTDINTRHTNLSFPEQKKISK